MKLEFLANGAPDCALIRLYAFTQHEVTQFKGLCDALATANLTEVVLHSQPGIQRVAGCELYLRVSDRDLGIVGIKSPFICALTKEAWAQVAFLTEPFCQDPGGTGHYQWLNEDGATSLLLSNSGTGVW